MKWLVLVLAACGDNRSVSLDVELDAPRQDAPAIDAAIDAPRMVRIAGNVDFGGGLAGVTMSLVGSSQTMTTDAHGDWYFDVPEGSHAIVRADATAHPELWPMIRGVVAADDLRPRIFYLMGPPDETSAAALGKSFATDRAIVEIDFRNAEIGGYGATVDVQPDYGIVYDDNGDPHLGTLTVAGGGGSTLLLAGLPPGQTTFEAIVPATATLPCQARDANPLPLIAGVVTWFDFECGTATDL